LNGSVGAICIGCAQQTLITGTQLIQPPKDKTSSEKAVLSSLDKLGVADLVRFIIAITPLLDGEILLCVWPAKIPAEEDLTLPGGTPSHIAMPRFGD
jgi:hypothetical protein